jgi:hypothetical protein
MSTFLSGQWNAICDRCGFKFKSSELKKDWQGLMVCSKDFETRHPQSLIRLKAEEAIPEWSRPEADDVFVDVCYIWSQSGYVGLGSTGCMKVNNTQFPYNMLITLRDNNG